MSVLIALTASLSTQTAQAQLTPCATGLFDGITWRESTVHIGDTVHFTINLTASGGNPPAGVCRLSQGTNWVVLPDGTVRIINMNFAKGACANPLGILCPPDGAGLCIGGLPTVMLDGVLWFEYGPILPSDDGRATLFVTPARPAFGPAYPGTPVTLFGTPGFISVAAVADAPSFDCESGTIFRGKASAAGNQPLQVVSACISITKDCVTNCPPSNAAAFGQRIDFQGTVRNCGSITLTNVTVVDQLPAGATPIPGPCGQAICFGNVQPGNTPFNGTLTPGQSVTYSGAYQPGGSGAALCGPFRDVVTASGTDASSIPRTVTATDDAVCTVCTTPCIDVRKDCIDTEVDAGTPIRYSFVVTNCGNVPLQNVVAVDDNATPTNPADDVTTVIGDLAIGGTRTVQGTFPTSQDDCRVNRFSFTNTVRVTGANICNPAQTVSDSDDCVARIRCQPCIRITEEVVCVRPDTQCDAFTPNPNDQTNACGFRNESGTDCSAFCFKITIEAVCIDGTPSPVPVTGIQVTSRLNLAGCNFPTTLQPGAMAMCVIPAVTLCTNFTDIVTVTASNVPPDADDTDSVSVQIKPIAVRCVSTFTSPVDTDGNPANNCVTLPSGSTNSPVTLTTTIFNDSDVDLVVNVVNLPPLVDCANRVTPVVVAQPIPIAARGTHVITGCYLAACVNVDFDITVRGTINVNTPDRTCVCFYNRMGQPIMTDVNNNDHCPVCARCTNPPDIEVTKEVACLLPGDTCGTFGKVATGVRDTACPAFCYRITVTNVGHVPIVALTVTDPVLGGNLSALFGPLPIAPGDTRQAIIKPIVHCVDTPDTVRAEGRSADGMTDVDQDSAEARVLHINVVCELSISPQEITTSGPVQVSLTLRNTGTAPLQVVTLNGLPALVDCNSGAPITPALPISIGAGSSANITGCMQVQCPAEPNLTVTATAAADDLNGTLCVYNTNGVRITDTSTCNASARCVQAGCTPGFWKNCTIHWTRTGYRTDQTVSSVFRLGNCCNVLGNVKLRAALDFGGGSTTCEAAGHLLRAGVAALLNAASPEVGPYPYTAPQVIALVNAALQSCDRTTIINVASELGRANERGCRDDRGNELPCQRLIVP